MLLPRTPQSPHRPARSGRRVPLLACALVVLPLITACTVDPVNRASAGEDAAVHTGPMRIAMITHGDDGGFWSIVRKGAEDSAATLPEVTLDYQGSAGDAKQQSEMIRAALNQGADGLAVSAPDIGAISGALAEAEAAGIPIVTLNSGIRPARADAQRDHPRGPERAARRGRSRPEARPRAARRRCCASCTR